MPVRPFLSFALAATTVALCLFGGAVACSSPTSATSAQSLSEAVVIDVRSPGEHADGHLIGDHNIPVDEVNAQLARITSLVGGKKDAKIVVYCASGRRSGRAKAILEAAGFTNVDNAGGFSGLRKTHPALVTAGGS